MMRLMIAFLFVFTTVYSVAAQNSYEERLFVHTDKDAYVSGDIIWFKLYGLPNIAQQSAIVSKIAYVELTDSAGHSVLQAKISLNKGEEHGSFQLPVNLASGNYTIRAYTNWMKNEGSDGLFQKNIQIINPFVAPASSVVKTEVFADFFPEGGNFVQQLENNIAFKITDASGKGLQAIGVVISNKNDTVARFSTLRFGAGSFQLKPIAGLSYQAVFSFNNKQHSFKLPDAQSNGLVLSVQKQSSEKYKISIQSTDLNNTNALQVQLRTKNQLLFSERVYLNNGAGVVFVEEKNLQAGLNQITVLDAQGNPLAERLVFKKPVTSQQPAISAHKETYTSREKVQLVFTGNAASNASVSVFKLDQADYSIADINSYYWLSDLPGWIEKPAYYFSDSCSERDADLLMLTHGWRKIISQPKPSNRQYPPELNGQLISILVTDKRTGAPASGVESYLSFPAKRFQFYTARTNEKGMAFFEAKDFYGQANAIFQLNTADTNLEIKYIPPFINSSEVVKKYQTAYTNDVLEERAVAMQVQKTFALDSLDQFRPNIAADTLAFYGKPDYSYHLDDYTRFTTMEEVLREYIREINVGGNTGNLQFKMQNEPRKQLFESGNTLVLIDGVPVHDVNKIFSYDPLRVKKLEVIPATYIYGTSVFNGIASFKTYSGEATDVPMEFSKTLIVELQGIQPQRIFYAPSYENAAQRKSRMPDFRHTLWWQPFFSKEKSSFYTSDMKGNYLVVCMGISEAGVPFTATSSFSVQ